MAKSSVTKSPAANSARAKETASRAPAPSAGVPPHAPSVGNDVQAMMMFESNKKSVGVAFLLWFFLGMFGAHRFYLGQTGTAIVMLLLTITLFGAIISGIWCLIDAFLIPGKIRDYNNKLAQAISQGGIVVLPTK